MPVMSIITVNITNECKSHIKSYKTLNTVAVTYKTDNFWTTNWRFEESSLLECDTMSLHVQFRADAMQAMPPTKWNEEWEILT